jgi:hypothetical protein
MDANYRAFVASEHLKGLSSVELSDGDALAGMQRSLAQFGPVDTKHFNNLEDAFDFLFPVKTFTTRYLVIGVGRWSLLLTDMREQNCNVEAYALSRATRCRGIGVTFRSENRELHLFEEGKQVRQVESCLDVDRWHYLDWGTIQPFEDIKETQRPRKKDRLSVDAVGSYFKTYTGFDVPNWKTLKPRRIFGLQRSLKDLEVELGLFETIRDV